MKSSINTHVILHDGKENTRGTSEEVEFREQANALLSRHAEVEEGFNIKYQVEGKVISRMGLDIEICTTSEMSESALKSAKSKIRKTLKVFEEEFGAIPASDETRKVTLYLFDDKYSLSTALEDAGIDKDSAGICFPQLGKIYVARHGKNKVENMVHELTHQLEYYATGGAYMYNDTTRFLAEGVADYIQYVVDNKKKVNLDFMGKAEGVLKLINDDVELSSAKSISEIAEIVGKRKLQQEQLKDFFSQVKASNVHDVGDVLDILGRYTITIHDYERARLQYARGVDEALDIIRQYVDGNNYNKLTYAMNRAIVKYMQETNPGLIAETFRSAAAAVKEGALFDDEGLVKMMLPDEVNILSDTFIDWLSDHTVTKFAHNHELLSVAHTEKIGYRNIIVDGKVRRSEVFAAKLEDKDGKEIGVLSSVEHISSGGSIRTINPNTSDLLRVCKEYHNIKLVNTTQGLKYVYCDSDGREQFKSLDGRIVDSFSEVLGKYNNNFHQMREALHEIRGAYLEYVNGMKSVDKHVLFSNLQYMYVLLKKDITNLSDTRYKNFVDLEGFANEKLDVDVSLSEIVGAIHTINNAYKVHVSETVQSLMAQANTGNEESEMLGRIFRSLIYIDPGAIVGVGKEGFDKYVSAHQEEIISLDITGKADQSAVSLFSGDKKIGELPNNVGAFTRYYNDHGHAVEQFIVSNTLKSIHTRYPGSPLVLVTQDSSGHKVVNLVSGLDTDNVNSDKIQVEINKFLDLVSKGTSYGDSFPLSKGIDIVTYDDRKNAVLDPEKAFAVKGAKIDDRGTEDTSDDRYEATVKIGDKVLIQKLSSMEFRITECRTDSQGNVIDASNLFMTDQAADKRFQFPESITHLKLVRDAAGKVQLVPSTARGNTNPFHMPDNKGQYAYIDPIFAYERMDIDWTSRHAKFDLIDFSKYPSGKLFKIAPDMNDPSVLRDSNGEIIRATHGSTYFTRVMIIDQSSGEKIGELASAPTFFQGDVFISFDRSYSSSDFISSLYHQEVEVENVGQGIKRVTMSGEGDLGTDSGYSDYYSFYHRGVQEEQHGSAPELHNDVSGRSGAHDEQKEAAPEVLAEKSYSTTNHRVTEVDDSEPQNDVARDVNCSSYTETKVYKDITYSENAVLQNVSLNMRATAHKVENGNDIPAHSLAIFNRSTGEYVQFPEEITHLKVVTLSGKKFLTPCTADGNEEPLDMPSNLGAHKYINPILVHEDVISHSGGHEILLVPMNLNLYADDTLFEMRHVGEKSYSTSLARNHGDLATVHLFHGDTEVGVLSRNTDVNYSGLLVGPSDNYYELGKCVQQHTDPIHTAQDVEQPSTEVHAPRGIAMYAQVGETPEDLDYAPHIPLHHYDDAALTGTWG